MKLRNWIKSQLTSSRKKEAAWVDLAVSLVDTIEAHVEDYIIKLKARSSLYEMDKESLLEEFKELRKIFPLGDVKDEDLPHVVMQRKDEIHFKKNLYPLISTMMREFRGVGIGWERLFAPKDQARYPYGTLLIPESQLAYVPFSKDELFLTSRGAIRISLVDIQKAYGGDIDEIERKIQSVLLPLIPLRIVLEGQLYTVEFETSELVEWAEFKTWVSETFTIHDPEWSEWGTQVQESFVTSEKKADHIYNRPRLDAIPIDSILLDTNTFINVPVIEFGEAIDGEHAGKIYNTPRMGFTPLDAFSLDWLYHS